MKRIIGWEEFQCGAPSNVCDILIILYLKRNKLLKKKIGQCWSEIIFLNI